MKARTERGVDQGLKPLLGKENNGATKSQVNVEAPQWRPRKGEIKTQNKPTEIPSNICKVKEKYYRHSNPINLELLGDIKECCNKTLRMSQLQGPWYNSELNSDAQKAANHSLKVGLFSLVTLRLRVLNFPESWVIMNSFHCLLTGGLIQVRYFTFFNRVY